MFNLKELREIKEGLDCLVGYFEIKDKLDILIGDFIDYDLSYCKKCIDEYFRKINCDMDNRVE